MKRILFYSEGWGLGGIETFIMNTIRELPRDQFQCDVFCTHDWSDAHDEELASLGAHRYCVFHGFKPNQLKRLTTSPREFRKLLRKNTYDVVHICTMNGMGFLYSNIARQENVPVRIVHSHNSDFGEGHRSIKAIFHQIGKTLWKRSATQLVSCSSDAGQYLFDSSAYTLIPNGIYPNEYKFDETMRIQVREFLGIPENALLIGSVGRIAEAKRPFFQVDILEELRAAGVNAYLLLVGDGPLLSSVREYSARKNLTEYVRFPGAKSNPQGYYSALDVFTMPSSFEGFGLSLIEAASSGLSCLISVHIPMLPYPLKQVRYVPSQNAADWACTVRTSACLINNQARENSADDVMKAGYSVEAMVRKLINLYQ